MTKRLCELKTILEEICPVHSDEKLSEHSSFRIGGEADLFAEPDSAEKLCAVLQAARIRNVPLLVVGRGSNLLFDDAGYRGLIVSTAAMRKITAEGTELYVDAGVSLTAAAKYAMGQSLTGMEFAHGIPGSCGGAVFMNAGAYDGEISQILVESTYYDPIDCTVKTLPAAAHEFGYRHSFYRLHPEYTILSAVFSLKNGNRDQIRSRMEELMEKRAEKQPLEYPSAGSVFKRYPGKYTAQMIDEAGLKGYSIGGAQVSEKHAGFIVNRGGATSADVLALISHIRAVIADRFGVNIETEMVYVPSVQGTVDK